MTQGTILALRDLGVRWPEQVESASIGVFSQARLYRPPLTLVSQPTHAMGERAMELLVNRPHDEGEGWGATIVLPNQVITAEKWQRAHEQLAADADIAAMTPA